MPSDWAKSLTAWREGIGWPRRWPADAVGTIGSEHELGGVGRAAWAHALAYGVWAQTLAATQTGSRRWCVDVAVAARALFAERSWAPRLADAVLPDEGRRDAPLLQTIYPTRDGRHFVPSALSPAEQHAWAHALRVPAVPVALREAIARRDGAALEALARRHRLCGALCRSAAQWQRHRQGAALGRTPLALWRPKNASAGAVWAPPTSLQTPPLAGMRVLCFGRVFAVPLAARLLAQAGADVLMVAAPGAREPRAVWLLCRAGTRSCTIDANVPSGQQTLAHLGRSAHAILENLRPGAFEKRIAPFVLRNSAAHTVHLSAFGPVGPWHNRPAYDMNVQACVGWLSAEGKGGSPCFGPSVLLADFVAAPLVASCAVLACLARKKRPTAAFAAHISLARVAMACLALGGKAKQTSPAWQVPASQTTRTPWGALRELCSPLRATPAWPAGPCAVPAPNSSWPAWRPVAPAVCAAPQS